MISACLTFLSSDIFKSENGTERWTLSIINGDFVRMKMKKKIWTFYWVNRGMNCLLGGWEISILASSLGYEKVCERKWKFDF